MPIPQTCHDLGSPVFRRMLVEQSALTISAATPGPARAVIPWSFIGDRIGRLRAMVNAVLGAAALGLVAAWVIGLAAVLVTAGLRSAPAAAVSRSG